jgi:hypothetical protein
MANDSGHLQVLEAFLVATVLLGAAYTVTSLRLPANERDRTRADLSRLTTDGLTVLSGLVDERGNYLDLGLTEAYHCLRDGTPSPTDCPTKTSANLSLRLESYLPTGAAYAVMLDNGVGTIELYRTSDPAGEVVTAGISLVPDWNLTFVLPELSCYETTMDVNASMVAIHHGTVASLTKANVTVGANMSNGTASYRPGYWNVTIPLANRTATGNITAVSVGKHGTYPGVAHYDSCDLGGRGNDIRGAIRNATLTLPTSIRIGKSGTLTADVTPFASTPGVLSYESSLVIYDPVTPRGTEPDTYVKTTTIPLGSGTTGSATWEAPTTSIYGAHPVVLRVNATVSLPSGGTAVVQARTMGIIDVALPNGIIPIEAPYRAVLQTWFPDWH